MEQKCCEKCEHIDYEQDEFDRGIGLTSTCRNSKCSCHQDTKPKEWLNDFRTRFKDWILQDDQEVYRSFETIENFIEEKLSQKEAEMVEIILKEKPSYDEDAERDQSGAYEYHAVRKFADTIITLIKRNE